MSWKITDAAHNAIQNVIRPGDCAIDATVGNGQDTLFLAKLVGESGQVFGFDIQKLAVEKTRNLLDECGLSNRVDLYLAGHETFDQQIPESVRGAIGAIMFNLGYLPAAEDVSITTIPENTLAALEIGKDYLRPGGLITIVMYTGHPGGKEEADAVRSWAASLDPKKYQSIEHRNLNQENNPPQLLVVSRGS